MAQVAAMSKYALPEQLFGEADLENEEVSLAASRCSYPPPDVSGELTIDAQLAAALAEDPHARKTEPDPHTRKTTPNAAESAHEAPQAAASERDSAAHSIEDAVLRVLEGGKRSIPRA